MSEAVLHRRNSPGGVNSFRVYLLCAVCALCLVPSTEGCLARVCPGRKSGPSICTLWQSLRQPNTLSQILNSKTLKEPKVAFVTEVLKNLTQTDLRLLWSIFILGSMNIHEFHCRGINAVDYGRCPAGVLQNIWLRYQSLPKTWKILMYIWPEGLRARGCNSIY